MEHPHSVQSLYMYKYTGPGCTQSCIYSEVNNALLLHFISTKGNSYNTHLNNTHFFINHSLKFNPLNPELNPICYLLALLGTHHFLHVSRIRVKSLTLTLLMSYIYIYIYIYIYMEHPFLMFLDHTQRRSTVGRTPLDE